MFRIPSFRIEASPKLASESFNKKTYAWSALSGLLLFLSFPKYGSAALAWVALCPLLLALRNLKPAEAFRAGFVTGLIYNVGILYWINYVIAVYGNLPAYAGLAAMLLLATFLALFVGVFSASVAWFGRRGVAAIFSAPLLWVALEFCKSHILTGFPWENLAYSQHAWRTVIQMCDITGFYGLSFLIVLVNVILSDLMPLRDKKHAAIEVAVGLVLMGLVVGYGHYRIADVQARVQLAAMAQVALIQGNIDQGIKWSPEFRDETLKIYDRLTREAASSAEKPDLVVWPETAVPFYFQNVDPRYRDVLDLARDSGAWLVIGSPGYKAGSGTGEPVNAAFVISPQGQLVGQYDKVHLVPFGEYVPLRRLLPFMTNIVPGICDFSTGDGFHPLKLKDRKIGVLICYEAIFPEIARAYHRAGAELLVNMTNDAWFGRTSAPFQHLEMAAFRAVETRRYIVRAANTGISAIIDPTGAIETATELYQAARLSGRVHYLRIETIYSRIGDAFVYGCLVLLGILFIKARRRTKPCRKS